MGSVKIDREETYGVRTIDCETGKLGDTKPVIKGGKKTGRLGDWRSKDWVIGRLEVRRLEDWETGRLGDWEARSLEDWEARRLGDCEVRRLGYW